MRGFETKEYIPKSDVGVSIVVGADPDERSIPRWALDNYGVMHEMLFYTSDTHENTDYSVNKCPH